MRWINKIIVHCSATPAGQNFCANDIDKWHRQRGWSCIGYHYVILLNGEIEKGRSLDKAGAHCLSQNANSIGICYIGGLDYSGKPSDTRTDAQKKSLINLISKLKKEYKAQVFGHRDFSTKACPCFDAKDEYDNL